MSSKMDRQGARSPADLENRYYFGKTFAEIMGIATDARDKAVQAQSAYDGLDQEEIFNRLTAGGTWEGFFYDDSGNMYINASYIKSGEFVADLIKAGVLQSVDGETFKLDLENGIFTLKSGGNTVMHVDVNGAELSGWEINQDYLGKEEVGLNGSIAHYGNSAKDGSLSTLRFFAGANDATQRKFTSLTGTVKTTGFFEASSLIDYMAADILNVMVLSITAHTPTGDISLSASDFYEEQPLVVHKTAANILSALGRFSNSAVYGYPVVVQISYDSCIPAFQVLDDGTLIAKYAEIGGHSIADLVARIEALEGK